MDKQFLSVKPSEASSTHSDSDDSGFIQSQDSFEEKEEEHIEATATEAESVFCEKKLITDFRRFSTIGTPGLEYGDIVNIPEVVVTSHDATDDDNQPPQHGLIDKRRRLRRSLSSPDGVFLSSEKMKMLQDSSDIVSEKQDDFSVTLEDVQKYKFLRKTSRDSYSSNDDRLNYTDDSWSYTNFSSSQTSEAEAGELTKESETGEVERKLKRSSWNKVRPVIHMIPFVQMYKDKKYPWVQLAGHPNNFMKGVAQGTVLKKYNAAEESCYQKLMMDVLSEVVPQYYGVTRARQQDSDETLSCYLELQCCLTDFNTPNICDVKMGVRTFQESEVSVTKTRHDLYLKMIKEDPEAPDEQERMSEAITKHRYLEWRDNSSSSRSLGFRLEGLTIDGKCNRNFKSTREYQDATKHFESFVTQETIRDQYIQRLRHIECLCSKSEFFSHHELIGSSLLFINDDCKASVWMIDFEKTRHRKTKISHNVPWELTNHEDGYLIGLNNLISIFESIEL